MRIGVLTSSRADYSIYFPLLKEIRKNKIFSLSIIAFGTHLSRKHGYTIERIIKDGFEVSHTVKTLPNGDSPQEISHSMGKTIISFADLWSKNTFDLVFCLGDRYEMFAACASAIPYNVKFAHIHGGEQTIGAIDDIFRHSITHMSMYHFTAAKEYRDRVIELKATKKNVYNVGSLSIDNLKRLKLYTIREINNQFGIDLSIPSILITFHPETIGYDKNELYIQELISALEEINDFQLIITMPNADTMGNVIRKYINDFISKNTRAIGVESFGTLGYLSCMKYCSFMLGNTSSGYIEASYFPKFVIDIGDRQKGRIVTPNIYKSKIKKSSILKGIDHYAKLTELPKTNIYGEGDSAKQIVKILQKIE